MVGTSTGMHMTSTTGMGMRTDQTRPHAHPHYHAPLVHSHVHLPDLHHRHDH